MEDRHTEHRGFTLLEMLVTVSVTVVLVLFLNQIFGHMSGAVSSGVATSQLIENNRVAIRQLAEDAQYAEGPAPGEGFLIILQKERLAQVVENGPPNQRVRTDQIAWIRTRQDLQPLCPAGADSYEPRPSNASHVHVWYGHALRTKNGGTGADGLTLGDNRLASRWILSRKAMFLGGANETVDVYINSKTDFYDWVINTNSHGNYPSGKLGPFMGYSDVLDRTLPDLNFQLATAAHDPLPHIGHPSSYYLLVYGQFYPWCNTAVNDSVAAYPSSIMAQAHPYLLENVSHFQVDFSGDFVQELPLDSLTDSTPAGITWYSAIPNTPGSATFDVKEPATYLPPYGSILTLPAHVDGFEEVIGTNEAIDPLRPIFHTNTGRANADFTLVWRPANLARWPRMIRLRYRLHDREGKITDRDGRPGKVFEQIINLPIFLP